MPSEREELLMGLLQHLNEERQFFKTSRGIFASPAERNSKVRFFDNCIIEVERWLRVEQAAITEKETRDG